MSRDPAPPTRHALVAGAMNRRLVDRMAAARSGRVFSRSRVLVYLLATLVNLVTLACLGLGMWLLLTGAGWPLRLLGALCVAVAIASVPRLPRSPRGKGLLDDNAFPATAALVAEVARVVDAPMPTCLRVDEDLNASAMQTGLRGRTLTIGAPLWVALGPQGRVALLAHELGHFANGDTRNARYVAAACHALDWWRDAFTADSMHDRVLRAWGLASSGGWLVKGVTWPVRFALSTYLRLIELADGPARRRQELYADLAAVRAGGTEGAVDLLETLLALDGVDVACNRAAVTPGRPPLRPAIEEFMATFDRSRRQQARARAAATASRIDDSHPPTVERLRLVESVEPTHAVIVLDPERAGAVDREMEKVLDVGLRRLADRFRG